MTALSRFASLTCGALALAAFCLASGCSSSEQPAAPVTVPLPEVIGSAVAEDLDPDPDVVEVRLEATTSRIEVDGRSVEMLGYNGMVPGPMIKVRAGNELVVRFRNGLDEPTTIHWHGLRIPDTMDGSPRLQVPVQPGEDFTYRFVVPEAGSYWYHPHVRAHAQVEAGLYAPLVVWDDRDPEYDNERYLMLDDVLLDHDGQRPPPFSQEREALVGRYGNHLLTNGQPAAEARGEATQGMVERWRLVNAANARTMSLRLEGASFRVVGTDGGLLPEPYTQRTLEIAVGQRYDLEVTYDRPGLVTLTSYFVETEERLPIYTVDVAPGDRLPRAIVWPVIEHPERSADRRERIVIDAVNGGEHGVQWRLNGQVHPEAPLFEFAEGETVEITLDNRVGPEHPFHLHGQFFHIVGADAQPGLKDTVLVRGMSQVKILAYFDNPGRWMAHCHILEHSEVGMMSELVVQPADGSGVSEPVGDHHH